MNIGNWIHFSIEGVIKELKDIHDIMPNSIFDIPFFRILKEIKENYGISTTLYVYEKMEGFELNQLPKKYWDELRKNHWIIFGWYGERENCTYQDIKAQKKSFERVCQLILSKLSKDQLDWVGNGKFYKIDGFLELWKKYNISKILVSKERKDLVDLSLEAYEHLQLNGYYRGDIYFNRKDIDMNLFKTVLSVEQGIEFTKDLLEKDIISKLECFCDRDTFHIHFKSICMYFQKLTEISLEERMKEGIFANAGCIVGDELFFSTLTDSNIYKLDLLTEKVSKFITLPIPHRGMLFQRIYFYNNTLFLLPGMLKSIWCINLLDRTYKEYEFPLDLKEQPFYWINCTRGICVNNVLWLLVNREKEEPVLISFDMEKKIYDCFVNWPKNIEFSDFLTFASLDEKEGVIYLFPYGSNKGVAFDIVSHEMREWNKGTEGSIGSVYKNKIFTAPAFSSEDKFNIRYENSDEIRELKKVKLKKSKAFDWLFCSSLMDNKILYFIPRLGDFLAVIDMEEEKLEEVSIRVEKYLQLSAYRDYRSFEMLVYGDNMIIMPWFNNVIVKYNPKTRLTKEIVLYQTVMEAREALLKYKVLDGMEIIEGTDICLEKFCKLKFYDIKDEKMQASVGSDIYKVVTK